MVLLILLAIIAIVVLIIVRPGSSSNGVPAPSSLPPVPSDIPASVSPPAQPSPSPSPSAAAQPAACDPANILVLPITDAQDYGPDAVPQLSMSISNTGTQPCTINAGTSQMVFTISSGDEQYWTSTDCQTNPSDQLILLEPAQPVTTAPIPWDRTRSAPDTCDQPRDAAPAGGASYHLSVSLGGVAGANTRQFILG